MQGLLCDPSYSTCIHLSGRLISRNNFQNTVNRKGSDMGTESTKMCTCNAVWTRWTPLKALVFSCFNNFWLASFLFQNGLFIRRAKRTRETENTQKAPAEEAVIIMIIIQNRKNHTVVPQYRKWHQTRLAVTGSCLRKKKKKSLQNFHKNLPFSPVFQLLPLFHLNTRTRDTMR